MKMKENVRKIINNLLLFRLSSQNQIGGCENWIWTFRQDWKGWMYDLQESLHSWQKNN